MHIAVQDLPVACPAGATLRRRPCVLDPRLLLSAWGPEVAALGARRFESWWAAGLRDTLRAPAACLEEPDLLRPRVFGAARRSLDPEATRCEIAAALEVWAEGLRQGDDLAVAPYFVGERRDESALPPYLDGRWTDQVLALSAALDERAERSGYDLPRGRLVVDAFRDTLALAAALFRHGGFILAALESDGAEAPALCDYARAWDLALDEVSSAAAARDRELAAEVASADLAPLCWAGAHLAVVRVVAPAVHPERAAEVWQRARIFWHRV